MAKFGDKSKKHLVNLHPLLQEILQDAIRVVDFTIICSYRGHAEQTRLFMIGKSKVKYPASKHNKMPAQAVDIAPWHPDQPHIRWENSEEFAYLAGIIKGIGTSIGVTIRWGGDWDRDGYTDDEHFRDLGHLELVLPKQKIPVTQLPGETFADT